MDDAVADDGLRDVECGLGLGPLELDQAMQETSTASADLTGREEAVRAPASLVQLDEAICSCGIKGQVAQPQRARGLSPAQLAADLMARLLAQPGQLFIPAGCQRQRRADVLLLPPYAPAELVGTLGGDGLEAGQEGVVGTESTQIQDGPVVPVGKMVDGRPGYGVDVAIGRECGSVVGVE